MQAINEDGLKRKLGSTNGQNYYWKSFLELCLCSVCDNSSKWNSCERVSVALVLASSPWSVFPSASLFLCVCSGHGIYKIHYLLIEIFIFIEIFCLGWFLPLERVFFVCLCQVPRGTRILESHYYYSRSRLESPRSLKPVRRLIRLCKSWFAFGSSLPLRAQFSGATAPNRPWFTSFPPLVGPVLQHCCPSPKSPDIQKHNLVF